MFCILPRQHEQNTSITPDYPLSTSIVERCFYLQGPSRQSRTNRNPTPGQATIIASAISRERVTRPPRTPTTIELSLLLSTSIFVPGRMPMAAKWLTSCLLDSMQATNRVSPGATRERAHWALRRHPEHFPCPFLPFLLHRFPAN